MKIIIELDVLQETDGLTKECLKENTNAILKKHFGFQCDLIKGKVAYFRNLGNVWGNTNLIVKLSKTEIIIE